MFRVSCCVVVSENVGMLLPFLLSIKALLESALLDPERVGFLMKVSGHVVYLTTDAVCDPSRHDSVTSAVYLFGAEVQ